MIFPERVDKQRHFGLKSEYFFYQQTGAVEFEALLDGVCKGWVMATGEKAIGDWRSPRLKHSVSVESQVLVAICHALAKHLMAAAAND